MKIRQDPLKVFTIFGVSLIVPLFFLLFKDFLGVLPIFFVFVVSVGIGSFFLLSYIQNSIYTDGNGIYYENFSKTIQLEDLDTLTYHMYVKKIKQSKYTRLDLTFADRYGESFTVPYSLYNKKEMRKFVEFCTLNYPDVEVIKKSDNELKDNINDYI